MAQRKVLSPILHDGKRYEPGKSIDLDDTEAAELEALGVIEPSPKSRPEPPAKGGKG